MWACGEEVLVLAPGEHSFAGALTALDHAGLPSRRHSCNSVLACTLKAPLLLCLILGTQTFGKLTSKIIQGRVMIHA